MFIVYENKATHIHNLDPIVALFLAYQHLFFFPDIINNLFIRDQVQNHAEPLLIRRDQICKNKCWS